MSGDPEQDYFADGVAQEIIIALSRCSGLFVIARNSSYTYKDKAIDIRRVGRELGVSYVLEGSVHRSGERLRITGQLIDATSGAHLWADRFEGDLRDVFELQDRVSGSVVAAIEPTLQFAEIGRRKQNRPNQLYAYDLLLRAYGLEYEFTAESITAALDCLSQALAIDPAYAPAMAAAAYCHAQRHFQGWAPQDDAGRSEAVRLAWHAVELAPNDAQVLWIAAFAVWNMAQEGLERARELFSRSLPINPNSAMALTLAGWIETMCGNQGEGREMIARAAAQSTRSARLVHVRRYGDRGCDRRGLSRGGDVGGESSRPEPALCGGASRARGRSRQGRAAETGGAGRAGTARHRAGADDFGLFHADTSTSRRNG